MNQSTGTDPSNRDVSFLHKNKQTLFHCQNFGANGETDYLFEALLSSEFGRRSHIGLINS